MSKRRFSIPFSLTLLALMGLIIVPLAGVLFWLGAETAETLEERAVRERLSALNSAVGNFLVNGLEGIVSVGATLAEGTSFRPDAGEEAIRSRPGQFVSLLNRQRLIAAAYVGYADGSFLYVGRTESLSAEQRVEYGAPAGNSIIVRRLLGVGPERREAWWFDLPDGTRTEQHTRPADYDPRRRPWYVEALDARRAILTDPYVFANADVVGISAGVPMRGDAGAFGFDITLDQLAVLIGELKITPNSIIMIGKPQGNVFIQTHACPPLQPGCLAGGGEARLALTKAVHASEGQARRHLHAGTGDRAYELFIEPMPPTLGRQFVVAAAVPVVELTADSRALLDNSALTAIIAIALAVLAVLAGSLRLSQPLQRIAAQTERIRHLDFSDTAPVKSSIREVQRLQDSVERMRDGLEVFGRYVSRSLVQRIMHAPNSTGMRGVRRDITVMFTDIEGFSRISEGLQPEVLTRRLSYYFEALGAPISANNGTIDKYIGDSIMAYWNAPETDEDHLAHACRAALEVAAASRKLADKWHSRGRPVFRTRIGVHTGPAVVGNVGTRERINYTLVGTVANQASRLEGLNKAYGTDILVSGEVAGAVADRFIWRLVDRAVPAGTTEVHDVYEPLGEAAEASQHASFLALWREAQKAYARADFAGALGGFRSAATHRPDDGPCRVFIARCETFLHQGPPPLWDGAWHFERK